MLTHLERLQGHAAIIADAMRTGRHDAPVDACPGWNLADLGRHMGFIHRWARLAATSRAAPTPEQIEAPPPASELGDWIDAGARELVAALAGLDPDEPTWHPFPVPRTARVWPRRQAHETMIHAWDATRAIGGRLVLEPAAAADNLAEYLEVIVARIITRDGRVAPVGTLTLHCTDTGHQFTIGGNDGSSISFDAIDPSPAARPHATLAASAEDLCLAVWHRQPLDQVVTDPLARAWLAFGGN